METVVLTDDELKPLEKRFGFCVRQMGPWKFGWHPRLFQGSDGRPEEGR